MPSSAQQAAYAPVGGEFNQGRPVGIPLHRQRDAQGVVPQSRRRKEWWWQPGPVDSYGCCFSVPCGVVYIASVNVIMGILSLSGDVWLYTSTLPEFQAQYASECEGAAAELKKCTDLADAIEAIDGSQHLGLVVPGLLMRVVNIVSCAIGLWAVHYANVRAIKLFLRSQVLVVLMGTLNIAIGAIASPKTRTGDEWAVFGLIFLCITLAWLYRLKVIWSYQMLMLARSRRNQVSPPQDAEAAVGMIELDGSSQVV